MQPRQRFNLVHISLFKHNGYDCGIDVEEHTNLLWYRDGIFFSVLSLSSCHINITRRKHLSKMKEYEHITLEIGSLEHPVTKQNDFHSNGS